MKFPCVVLLGLIAVDSVKAEDSKRWSGDTELGFKSSKGNTNQMSLSFRQSIILDYQPWKNTVKLNADNTVSSGIRTEERYYLTEQIDRSFTKRSYGLVRFSYHKDLFSGFAYQSSYAVGFGYKFIDNKQWHFSVETGIGGIYEKLEGHKQPHDNTMYYFADKFTWQFSKTAQLGQSATIEYSRANTITRTNIFVKSSLISSISIRLSYGIKHNSEVPIIEGKKISHTDTEVLATVVYGF